MHNDRRFVHFFTMFDFVLCFSSAVPTLQARKSLFKLHRRFSFLEDGTAFCVLALTANGVTFKIVPVIVCQKTFF